MALSRALPATLGPAVQPSLARDLWHRLEPLHAVTYFSPEGREAPARLGLKGFWMGYFAGRAAPLGAVPPAVVEAAFYNFHPARVRRALPDAWALATPGRLVETRAAVAATALRRLLGARAAEHLAADVAPLLEAVVEHGMDGGRPLFAANRALPRRDDPVEALWQATTSLREHRGDGHVAVLTDAGLDGCEVHVLVAAERRTPADLYLASRGWSGDDWRAATARLGSRGLLAADGTLSDQGRARRQAVERRTDELAFQPYRRLGEGAVLDLLARLEPAARRIGRSGEIADPNPMGLPLAEI